MLCLVCQHRWSGDITYRINSGNVRSSETIRDDGPALGLDAEAFQAEPFDIADNTDGGDDLVHLDGLGFAVIRLDRRGNRAGRLFRLRHLCAGKDLYSGLFEPLARQGGDFRILDRQDLGQQLNNRHFRAHGPIERCKFNSDGA